MRTRNHVADGESGGRSGLIFSSKSHLKKRHSSRKIKTRQSHFQKKKKKKIPSIISSILRGACVWVRCSLAATPVLLFISGFLHSADLPAPRQDFIPCHCAREHARLILFEKRHSQFASQGKPPTRAASSWPPNKSAAPGGPAGTSKTPCAKHGPWANQHFVPTFFPLAQDVITKPPRADKCEIRENTRPQAVNFGIGTTGAACPEAEMFQPRRPWTPSPDGHKLEVLVDACCIQPECCPHVCLIDTFEALGKHGTAI